MTVISKLGPGLWFSIHFQALRATTPEAKLSFAGYINELAQNFPCASCGEHFRTYLGKHPLINYWHVEYGLFKWSVDFHNDVNQRLGKTQISYNDAMNIYQSPQTCDNCVGNSVYDDNDDNDDNSIITTSSTVVPKELLNYLAQQGMRG